MRSLYDIVQDFLEATYGSQNGGKDQPKAELRGMVLKVPTLMNYVSQAPHLSETAAEIESGLSSEEKTEYDQSTIQSLLGIICSSASKDYALTPVFSDALLADAASPDAWLWAFSIPKFHSSEQTYLQYLLQGSDLKTLWKSDETLNQAVEALQTETGRVKFWPEDWGLNLKGIDFDTLRDALAERALDLQAETLSPKQTAELARWNDEKLSYGLSPSLDHSEDRPNAEALSQNVRLRRGSRGR